MIVFHILGLLLAALIAWASMGWWIKSGNSTGPLYGLLFAGLLVVGIWMAHKRRRAIHARNKQYKEQVPTGNQVGRWLDDQFTTQAEKDVMREAMKPRAREPELDAPNRRLNSIFIRWWIVVFLLGLLFPKHGPQALGIFGLVIDFAADVVPSINKMASVSPHPELVRGYFGTIALLVPIVTFILLRREPLGVRSYYALNRLGVDTKRLLVRAYGIGVPFCVLMLWVFWTLPGTVRLGLDTGRGQMILHLMLTSRFAMTIFGSIVAVSILMFLFGLAFAFLGPVYRLFDLRRGNR